jgi:hypothetical protein
MNGSNPCSLDQMRGFLPLVRCARDDLLMRLAHFPHKPDCGYWRLSRCLAEIRRRRAKNIVLPDYSRQENQTELRLNILSSAYLRFTDSERLVRVVA